MITVLSDPTTHIPHPLLVLTITELRDVQTQDGLPWARCLDRAGGFLASGATKTLEVTRCEVQTPVSPAAGFCRNKRVALVPVFRAGDGLTGSFLRLLPDASVFDLDLSRDEHTGDPTVLKNCLPETWEDDIDSVIILEVMLATGGSACQAIELVKAVAGPKLPISFVAVFAARTGVNRVLKAHPDVALVIAQLDEVLTPKFFIDPGCGDAGKRSRRSAR